MNKTEIRIWLKDIKQYLESNDDVVFDPYNETSFKLEYLGSYMNLDPCGKYHHILSPNGATKKCERFWENLESVAEELGGWIESGEGDPTDIFFCIPVENEE